jgi:hypothetical protein
MEDAVQQVGCLVSIGTGQPTFETKKSTIISQIMPVGITSLRDAASTCVRIATDCHRLPPRALEDRKQVCHISLIVFVPNNILDESKTA